MISVNDKRKPPTVGGAGGGERARFVSGGATEKRAREKLTVYVDREVLTALRIHCARERKELSDVTTAALAKLLNVRTSERPDD